MAANPALQFYGNRPRFVQSFSQAQTNYWTQTSTCINPWANTAPVTVPNALGNTLMNSFQQIPFGHSTFGAAGPINYVSPCNLRLGEHTQITQRPPNNSYSALTEKFQHRPRTRTWSQRGAQRPSLPPKNVKPRTPLPLKTIPPSIEKRNSSQTDNIMKQDLVAEFEREKEKRFAELDKISSPREIGNQMVLITDDLINLITTGKPSNAQIEDVFNHISNDAWLQHKDKSRILLWTLVFVSARCFCSKINLKCETNRLDLNRISSLVESAFTTVTIFSKMRLRQDSLLLEEVVSMINHFELAKLHFLQEIKRDLLEMGKRIGCKNLSEKCRSYRYYFTEYSTEKRDTRGVHLPKEVSNSFSTKTPNQPLIPEKQVSKPKPPPKRNVLAEFQQYKKTRFVKLDAVSCQKEKGNAMVKVTNVLIAFVTKRKLSNDETVEICSNLVDDPIWLHNRDISRVILWALICIAKFYYPKNASTRSDLTITRTLDQILRLIEKAFSTALPKMNIKDNYFLLREVISMMNHLQPPKASLPQEFIMIYKYKLKRGTEFCWSDIVKSRQSYEYYFQQERNEKADQQFKTCKELWQIFQKWGQNDLGNCREKYFEEILIVSSLLRKAYSENYGQTEISKMLMILENGVTPKLTISRWASFCITFLWAVILALEKDKDHMQMCSLVLTVLRKIATIDPDVILGIGVTALELWSIFFNFKTNSKNCMACLFQTTNVSFLTNRVFPRDKLRPDEDSGEARECRSFFFPEIGLPSQSTIILEEDSPPLSNNFSTEEEGKSEDDDLITTSSSSSSSEDEEIESYQSLLERKGLKKASTKSEEKNEKVFILPERKPLSLEEILKGKVGTSSINDKSISYSENKENNFHLEENGTVIEDFTENSKNEKSKSKLHSASKDRNEILKSKGTVPSQNNLSNSGQDNENPRKSSKKEAVSEKLSHTEEEYVMISLRNLFCRKMFVDLTSISRKQGMRQTKNGLELVFFLDKSAEAEELQKAFENNTDNLCQCCNPETS